jgi:hypothetical protein
MRIYLHEPQSEPTLLEDVEETARFRDICRLDGEAFVFLDDDDEPVEVDLLIVEVLTVRGRKPSNHHIHRHPCRAITVDVHYGGDTRDIRITPNQTVGALLTKAIQAYGLDAAAGSDLVLRRPGSNDDLPQAEHVGDLHPSKSCKLELNLLPAHREAG